MGIVAFPAESPLAGVAGREAREAFGPWPRRFAPAAFAAFAILNLRPAPCARGVDYCYDHLMTLRLTTAEEHMVS